MAQDWFPWVVASVGVPCIGALFALLYAMNGKFEARFARAREERIIQIAETRAEARAFTNDQTTALRENMQAFQVKVLEDYVSNRTFREFRIEIMAMLEKMEGKIDRLGDGGVRK